MSRNKEVKWILCVLYNTVAEPVWISGYSNLGGLRFAFSLKPMRCGSFLVKQPQRRDGSPVSYFWGGFDSMFSIQQRLDGFIVHYAAEFQFFWNSISAGQWKFPLNSTYNFSKSVMIMSIDLIHLRDHSAVERRLNRLLLISFVGFLAAKHAQISA
jgi:hypothetical protein